MINLSNKRALVTGGTKGIGLAISLALREAGAKVLPVYKNDWQAAQRSGFNRFFGADLSTVQGVSRLLTEIETYFPDGFDIFVHCAGINIPGKIEDVSIDNIDEVLRANLWSAVVLCKALKSYLCPGASIVLIGSVSASVGPVSVHYAASKAGLEGLTKSLARAWGADGVRVNCVAPGYIESPMASAGARHPLVQQLIDTIPLERLGKAEEVGGMVAFLASDLASYITGQVIHVNGGLYG